MKAQRWVILIVEDDENDRLLIERSLKKVLWKGQIRFASDGEEAIAYLNGTGKYADRKEFPFPTLMFVDLKMPKLDGFAVLQEVKNNPQWAIIPTLVFSASDDLDDIKKAYVCGTCGYHVKPGTNAEREKLCRLLLDYWAANEVPETDDQGAMKSTDSTGKLGERFGDTRNGGQ